MNYYPNILISFFTLSLILNYLSFYSKKTAIQLVNEMGFGYNLGITFNCCKNLEEEEEVEKNHQIKLWGTILPTKKIISKIKKYGFKTIRFNVEYKNLSLESENINSEWISGVKEVVDSIINFNMYCILSIHHDREFWIIEGEMAKDIYANFWKQVANEFINYDEHLAFESMNELDFVHFTLLNTTQAFIDVVRNSEGLNKERLLIISEMYTENELNNYYVCELPIDPANKFAISLHYYFPSESLYEYDIPPFDWYDNTGFYYQSAPIIGWGIDDDYKSLMEKFDNMKEFFISKGIPVIIGEVGILTKDKNNINSIRQFLYSLFSISSEIDGIMPCLWDCPLKYSDNIYYYNRETDKWNDEIIKENFLKISKGKFIKSSDYYKNINIETIIPYYNTAFLNFGKKNISKIFINAKLLGRLGIDIEFLVSSVNKNDKWFDIIIKKENGKKQYDGTTIFTIDISKEDVNEYLYVSVNSGFEYININNITIEYVEKYSYFDYNSYKYAILNDISK